MRDPDSGLFTPMQKRAVNIRRVAACRENTPAPFGDQLQAQRIEKGHEFAVEKAGKGLPEKRTCFTEMKNKVGYFGDIGDIAAALSGNTELEAGPFHFFKQTGLCSGFSRLPRSHQPCRATADDNDMSCLHYSWFSHFPAASEKSPLKNYVASSFMVCRLQAAKHRVVFHIQCF